MPKKYHIYKKNAPPRFRPVGRYTTVQVSENCAGSCKQCVKKRCIYDVFKENQQHISHMAEPEYLYTCMSCFRCIQECTKGIFSRTINPEYRRLGDRHWRPDILQQLWYQAHTGKIPVSGAGYGGPFTGPGFDAMWTDMSEIVRPTRDGIHGREYINTCVELSRRPMRLIFDDHNALTSPLPTLLEVPLPLLFALPADLTVNVHMVTAVAQAAHALGTLLRVPPAMFSDALTPWAQALIPCLAPENLTAHDDLIRSIRMVALEDTAGIETVLDSLRKRYPHLALMVDVPLNQQAETRAVQLARAGVDTLYLCADDQGMALDTSTPQFLKEMIRRVHLELVRDRQRHRINLVFAGGIAMAEHMAKAIICGADAVAIDRALWVALECRLCGRCRTGRACPVKLDVPFDPQWGCQRIVNLAGAWYDQLIELMGAMGIREARRLRGEVGRAMGFEELEKEHFGLIFGERSVPAEG